MRWLQFLVLTGILLYASVSDIRRREVPDFVSVMVAIVSLVDIQVQELYHMIWGATLVFAPQIVVCLLTPDKTIGGADIKLSTAAGFLLGAEKGLFALGLGLFLAVCIVPVKRRICRELPGEAFPLVPFLSVGILTAYIL